MPTITKTKIAVTILRLPWGFPLSRTPTSSAATPEPTCCGTRRRRIFCRTHTLGYRVKWIGYPLEYGLATLGYVEHPNDEGVSFLVIHVNSSGVERHALDLADFRQGGGPIQFAPRVGRIWANWPKLGGLCWWAGDHFQPASQEEQRAFNGIAGLTEKDFDAGWQKDGIAADGERKITIRVGKEFELLLSGRRASDGRGVISVDMQNQAVRQHEYST